MAMSPEFWQRVKETTAAAMERPEAERLTWVAESCAGDEVLRREVESLLAADASAGSFLESAAIAHPGHAEAIAAAARASLALAAGRRIGPYRIVREIGHGGMGVVYLAERADAAFEKKTAIKVVRGGGLLKLKKSLAIAEAANNAARCGKFFEISRKFS